MLNRFRCDQIFLQTVDVEVKPGEYSVELSFRLQSNTDEGRKRS